jgi:hypothetical protein
MTSGGRRNRSGPQPTEGSRTSDRAGFSLTALPPAGHDGEAPDFPLQNLLDREAELWAWAWTTPQAAAWAREPWRWHTIAMWVRTAVICEGLEATAADKGSLHRFADQIGMTPAGLKENGWKIAEPEKPAASSGPGEVEDDPRLRLVRDGSGG